MNPPCRNPLDRAKYREQYLSNLRLQASNDEKNLNANKIFKITGQTPSQPKDYRGTTEKAMDAEGSKVALRQKLGTVTDGVIASQIVGELSPEQVLFALNKWEIIARDMKEQFAKGVPSSAFIAYLNRLIQKYQRVEGVEEGLQQSVGEAIVLSNIQLLYGLPRERIYSILRQAVQKAEREIGGSPMIDDLKEQMTLQERMIVTPEELEYMSTMPVDERDNLITLKNQLYQTFPDTDALANVVGEINLGLTRRDRGYVIRTLNGLRQFVTPSPESIQLRQQMNDTFLEYTRRRAGVADKSTQTATDQGTQTRTRPPPVGRRRARSADPAPGGGAGQTAPSSAQEGSPFVSPAAGPGAQARVKAGVAAEAQAERTGARRESPFYEAGGGGGRPPPFQLKNRGEWSMERSKASKLDYLNAVFAEVPNLEASITLPNGTMSDAIMFSGRRIAGTDGFTVKNLNEIYELTKPRVENYMLMTYGVQPVLSPLEMAQKGMKPPPRSPRPARAEEETPTSRGYNYEGVGQGGTDAEAMARMRERMQRPKGKGIRMKGSGIVKPYEQSIAHLIDKPIEKVKPYTAFGRYYINKQRLKDKDIVALRYASGNVIAGMPAEKVSKPLAGVFRTLVGGGLPSYEEVSALSPDEKLKLSAICTRCGVDSPAVPHMKGEGEAEMDKFNVLRGEIIAGNDAPKIAREFKTMLLKFMNEGRIPKSQGNSILHEMLSLGV